MSEATWRQSLAVSKWNTSSMKWAPNTQLQKLVIFRNPGTQECQTSKSSQQQSETYYFVKRPNIIFIIKKTVYSSQNNCITGQIKCIYKLDMPIDYQFVISSLYPSSVGKEELWGDFKKTFF